MQARNLFLIRVPVIVSMFGWKLHALPIIGAGNILASVPVAGWKLHTTQVIRLCGVKVISVGYS